MTTASSPSIPSSRSSRCVAPRGAGVVRRRGAGPQDRDVDDRAGALPEEVEGPAALLGRLAEGGVPRGRVRVPDERDRPLRPGGRPDPALGGRGDGRRVVAHVARCDPARLTVARLLRRVRLAQRGRVDHRRDGRRPCRLGVLCPVVAGPATGSLGGAATVDPSSAAGVETTRARLAAREVATRTPPATSDRRLDTLRKPTCRRGCSTRWWLTAARTKDSVTASTTSDHDAWELAAPSSPNVTSPQVAVASTSTGQCQRYQA